MKPRKRIEYDLSLIEELAAIGTKQTVIAAKLRLEPKAFYYALHSREDVRAAYDRGVARRAGRAPETIETTATDEDFEIIVEATSENFQMPDDAAERVFACIKDGFHLAREIKEQTGLSSAAFALAVEELEQGLRVVRREDTKQPYFSRYYIYSEAWQPETLAAGLAIPVASQPPAHSFQDMKATKVETDATATRVAEVAAQHVAPVAQEMVESSESSGQGEQSLEVSYDVEAVIIDEYRDALEAARIEMLFSRYWGEPSHKVDSVLRKTERVLGAQSI